MMPDANIYGAFIDRHKLYTLWDTATLCKDVPAYDVEELTNLGVDFHMSHAMASLDQTNVKVNDIVSSFVAQCG